MELKEAADDVMRELRGKTPEGTNIEAANRYHRFAKIKRAVLCRGNSWPDEYLQ